VTDYILTKMISIVKTYFSYFSEGFKYFYSNRIASSGNYNYSIIEGEVQGVNSYFVSRESYLVL